MYSLPILCHQITLQIFFFIYEHIDTWNNISMCPFNWLIRVLDIIVYQVLGMTCI